MHYRILDVSTVNELGYRWYPEIMKKKPKKSGAHRALTDIQESIKELKFYKENMFIKNWILEFILLISNKYIINKINRIQQMYNART